MSSLGLTHIFYAEICDDADINTIRQLRSLLFKAQQEKLKKQRQMTIMTLSGLLIIIIII